MKRLKAIVKIEAVQTDVGPYQVNAHILQETKKVITCLKTKTVIFDFFLKVLVCRKNNDFNIKIFLNKSNSI